MLPQLTLSEFENSEFYKLMNSEDIPEYEDTVKVLKEAEDDHGNKDGAIIVRIKEVRVNEKTGKGGLDLVFSKHGVMGSNLE